MVYRSAKFKLLIIVIMVVLSLGFYAYNWQSPDANQSAADNLHQCIYKSDNKRNIKVRSLNNKFDISYVENSGNNCINLHFPSIHIYTNAKHDGWLHIIYTDSEINNLQAFVDTVEPSEAFDIYPFYTLEQDFYDAPLWKYNLFNKPISFWKGHAWAVDVDFEKNIIRPVGGISWGYNLSYWRLYPTSINPSALDLNDWNKDWKIFHEWLSYKNYETQFSKSW